MSLGNCNSEELAESIGAAVARGLRSVGINWNLAPVVDVNCNPNNPVIADVDFTAKPDIVTRLAGAWMAGSLKEGVACCLKHFPGHGDTHVDSHFDLPTVDKPFDELEKMEFFPFRQLAKNAPAIMTAHIIYSQLDSEHPATLSPKILRNILREQWGYKGVVITDALMMNAIKSRYGYAEAAGLALHAGADMVLAQGTPEEKTATVNYLKKAFDEGKLDRNQGAKSQQRLDVLAQLYPYQPSAYPAEYAGCG